MLGPLRLSLRATLDHHGPSIHSAHYTASINCCKKINAKTTKLRNLTLLIAKTPLLHILYLWIDWLMNIGLEQEGGSVITPMALAYPPHPINSKSRNKRRNLWVGRCVSSCWPVFPSRNYVLIYIYINVCVLHTSSCYRTYININSECRSVLVKLHPITVYRTVFCGFFVLFCFVLFCFVLFCLVWFVLFVCFFCVFLGGVRSSCVECHLLFSSVSPIVTCSVIKRLMLWCLWPLVFVLNNILILGILHSPIAHLRRCFFPWTFFKNIYGTIGPHYIPSSNSTRVFYRGVSGFGTDCPCGVWCRGLTTCFLYISPLFGNRLLNNSWAVGLI